MDDIRVKPAYPITEAARMLGVRPANLQYWFPPRQRTDKSKGYLNFLELLQGYIIQALRSHHNISMQKIRKAMQYLKKETGSDYPLALNTLRTDHKHIFIKKLGALICASEAGQVAMEGILEAFLERVKYDQHGVAQSFFPYTSDFRADSKKYIIVDPRLNFGRPCLVGRGIGTAIIYSRFKAGEAIEELADDYNCNKDLIQEAIRAEPGIFPASPLAA